MMVSMKMAAVMAVVVVVMARESDVILCDMMWRLSD